MAAANSIDIYLTGATVDGGPQLDHALSFGNYRSHKRAGFLTAHRYSALPNVTLEYVSANNGVGIGGLKAETADTISWTPPNGTAGVAVTVANGSTVTIFGTGADADKFVIVTRTSASDLIGTEVTQLLYTVNNVVGGSNFSEAQSTAGDELYRALMLKNNGSNSITNVKFWFDNTYDISSQIAKETPDGNGALTEVGDEETQPGGLAWSTPVNVGTALNLGTLAAGAMVGLWIERFVLASASADARLQTVLNYQFTEDGDDYTGIISGLSRIAEAGIEAYELYTGDGVDPDLDAAPTETFASLPHTTSTSFAASKVWHMQLAYRNPHDLRSPLLEVQKVRTDDSLNPPLGPQIVSAYPRADGTALIIATYFRYSEARLKAAADANAATHWLIFVSDDGTDPIPADTPVVEAMAGRVISRLSYTTPTEYLEDQPLKIAVATRRDEGGGDTVDSDLSDIVNVTAEHWGPVHAEPSVSAGQAYGIEQGPIVGPTETVYIDEGDNIRWEVTPGQVVLWGDSVKIWTLKYDSSGAASNGLYLEFGLVMEDIDTAGTAAAVDVISWTIGDKRLGVNVREQRRMEIDVTNTRIKFNAIHYGDPDSTRATVPAWRKWGSTCFQVWDMTTQEWLTAFDLDTGGLLRSLVGIR